MRRMRRAGLYVVVAAALLSMIAGCVPSGAVSNPGWTVVAADGQTVYAALASGRVLALGAQDGKEQWLFPVQQQKSSSPLGGLFAPKQAGGDADKPLDAVYGLPVLTDKLVLVASYNHKLYAFERATGAKMWEFSAQAAIIGGATVRDGVVYFGSADHNVYALDVSTGKPVWAAPFETGGWVWGAPAVDDQRVYVGSMDHYVYAIRRSDGSKDWERKSIGASVVGSMTLADGILLVGAIDRQLHALKAADGSELWVRDLGHWVWGEAIVHDGFAYVGTLDGKVHALRVSDGSPRWDAVALDGAVRAGPAVLTDAIVVGTETGSVYRIEMESGETRLLHRAAGAVLSTPAIVGNHVYVGTTVGNVTAFDTTRSGDATLWVYPPAKTK